MKKSTPFLFLFPSLIFIVFFSIYPIAFGISMAFFNWKHFTRGEFAGLSNFVKIFNDREFIDVKKIWNGVFTPPLGALIHSILWIIIFVPLATFLGLIIAFYVRDLKGASIIRTIIFSTYVLPLAVFGWMLFFIYDYNAGILNGFLKSIGLSELAAPFLFNTKTVLLCLIFSSLYVWLGFSTVLFSAGIDQIPRELFEVAVVEGASGFQMLRYICYPLLKPVTRMVLTLATVYSLRMFDLVQVATRGGPGSASLVLDVLVYRKIFLSSPSYLGEAGAIIVISLMLFLAVVSIIDRVVK